MRLSEIEERFSIRNFSNKPVSDEIIENILEAARLAPSWVNTQPWHFIIIKDKETKELLAQLAYGQPHLVSADTVIVCCADKTNWEEKDYRNLLESKAGLKKEKIEQLLSLSSFNPKLKGEEYVHLRCIEQVSYAIAYMTLEAHKNGVGCCIVGHIGNEFTNLVPEIYAKVKERLNLPSEFIITTLLPIGYPAEDNKNFKKIRKEKKEIVSYEIFKNKTK